jgi:solute:Na+ symporter, SSS family
MARDGWDCLRKMQNNDGIVMLCVETLILIHSLSVQASVFSGYTVVGVPTQAYNQGWIALQWVASIPAVIVSFLALAPRLRKIGVLRRHQSPVDFITDRYQSQIMRYTVTLLMVVPSLISLAAQLAAIRSTFNSLFNIQPDSPWAAVAIAGIIVLCEWIGGMRSVAFTDCIQGIVMIACFVALPIVVVRQYGGWSDLDWETYPRQSFYQTPSRDQQWMYWNFGIMFLGFTLNPFIMQRIYAADSFKSLKVAYNVLSLGPWFAFLPGIFLGTIAVQWLADLGLENVSNPFAATLEAVMDMGGFPYVVGIVASIATLAAIMSTADSILISVSHLVTSEVILPLFPKASHTAIENIGRATSLFTMALAIVMAIYGGQNLVQLISIQYGILLMILPVYLFGLYGRRFDPHPWSLAIAAICGAVSVGTLHFTYGQRAAADQPFVFNTGVMGLLLNVTILVSVEAISHLYSAMTTTRGETSQEASALKSSVPMWDTPDLSRFQGGTDLVVSGEFIWNAMAGIREPVVDGWFILFGLAVSLFLTPITEPSTPPLDESGKLIWAPKVIRGIPSWAFQVIMVLIPVTVFLLYAINSLPNTLFPKADGTEALIEVTPALVDVETTLDDKERTSTRCLGRIDTQIGTSTVSDSSSDVEKDVDM